ncbi:MAG: VapE family protein [Romboutsia sp.]
MNKIFLLPDVTGNRRFWPVHVNGESKLSPWDLKGVDQIWAEAIVNFKKLLLIFSI